MVDGESAARKVGEVQSQHATQWRTNDSLLVSCGAMTHHDFHILWLSQPPLPDLVGKFAEFTSFMGKIMVSCRFPVGFLGQHTPMIQPDAILGC